MMLRQLEYFVAICEYGNYTIAAERLHVSQPSITVAIQNLEKELNTVLMHRSKGKVTLTESGIMLFEFAKKMIDEIEMVKKKIDSLSEDYHKVIDLTTVPNMGIERLTKYTEKFRQTYNIDVHLQALTGSLEVVKSLDEKRSTVGFAHIDDDIRSRYNTIPIQDLKIHALINKNHKLKDKKYVTLEMLKDERIGMYKRGTTYCEKRVVEEFKKEGITPQITYESDQYSLVYSMIAMGYCIGFTPDPTASIIQNNSDIIVKPLDKDLTAQVGLVWNKNERLPDSARKFVDFVKDSVSSEKDLSQVR